LALIKVPEVEETPIYRFNHCISENNTSNMHLRQLPWV